MPLFAIHCLDKPGHVKVRQDNRKDHLAWLETYRTSILVAGPMMAPDGESPAGSLLILDLPDLEAAYAWCTADPYARAGLFESVVVRPYKVVFGAYHRD